MVNIHIPGSTEPTDGKGRGAHTQLKVKVAFSGTTRNARSGNAVSSDQSSSFVMQGYKWCALSAAEGILLTNKIHVSVFMHIIYFV